MISDLSHEFITHMVYHPISDIYTDMLILPEMCYLPQRNISMGENGTKNFSFISVEFFLQTLTYGLACLRRLHQESQVQS